MQVLITSPRKWEFYVVRSISFCIFVVIIQITKTIKLRKHKIRYSPNNTKKEGIELQDKEPVR